MASYVGQINQNSTTMPIGSTLYGTCETAANTAAKVVTCANFDKLLTGVTIHIKFTYSNTIANPTLNVNSTGAKSIYRYGTTTPNASLPTSWYAGAIISFTYDGAAWVMNDYTYAAPIHSGTCPTAADVAAKEVFCPACVELTAGTLLTVTFTYANTASSPTLNVNNLGAKSISFNGGTSIGFASAKLYLQGTIQFKYTGTTWEVCEPVLLSKNADPNGLTDYSLVTTAEKSTWNNKSNLTIGTTSTTAAAGNHTHGLSIATDSGTNQLTMAANTKYKLTAGGSTYIFTTPSDNNTTYTFSGGTNKFTVTPLGGSAQDITITPSIANNITGTGLNGYLAKFNGTNTLTQGPSFGTNVSSFLRNDGTWAIPPCPSFYSYTSTLTSTTWDTSKHQSITITNLGADDMVFISPYTSQINNYCDFGIYCYSQTTNTLFFSCASTPTVPIGINVLKWSN